MKNSTKFILVLAAVVIIGAAAYSFRYHGGSYAAISPAGQTGSTGKYLSTTMSLTGTSGTTTAVLNPYGFDVAVRSTDVTCSSVGTSKTAYTGTGLASLNFKMATSSSNTTTGNVTDINANYFSNINVGTSTPDDYAASSTEGVISGTSRIIPAGTYAIISSNATNTASCAIGISVMPL